VLAGLLLAVVGAGVGLVAWQLGGNPRTAPPTSNPDTGPASVSSPRPGAILIVVPQQYQHVEYLPLRDVLDREGKMPVKAASTARTNCTAMPLSGLGSVTPDFLIDENLKAADFAAVVFVGGTIYEYKEERWPAGRVIHQLINDMLRDRKPVAAVASGIRVLAHHGTLLDRKAAHNDAVLKDIPNGAKEWIPTTPESPVVKDGYVMTTGDPRKGAQLARELLDHLRRRP
jgi:putative intracellular protease/amidase